MIRSSLVAGLNPEFDSFLQAPIDEDKNGVLLSVLSALARLDIDPWQEAANLTDLPRNTATQRLASLIGALPDEPLIHRNPAIIAARLIALLPHEVRSIIPPHQEMPETGAMAASVKLAFLVLFLMCLISVVASSQKIDGTQPSVASGNDQLASHATASKSFATP